MMKMTKKNIKKYEPKRGDIVEMDYQKSVSYIKGFSNSDKADDGQRLVLIHHEWDSHRREWLGVARQRLRFIGR